VSFKVAVLEDEPALLNDILVPGLTSLGFETEGFGAAKDLYRRMLAKSFDAIVLDICLPDENGFEVARYLRAHAKLVIVALSGLRLSEADKAKMQADAWLMKPIDVEVIGAVLSDLHKRRQGNGAIKVVAKKWWFDPANWKLYSPDGRHVTLGLSERLIMEQLLSTPGEVVARDDLIVALTDSTYDFDPHRLEMLIHRLRRKVHKALDLHLPLQTVRGMGYTMLISADDSAHS
jgi:two-component system response regulator PhoP